METDLGAEGRQIAAMIEGTRRADLDVVEAAGGVVVATGGACCWMRGRRRMGHTGSGSSGLQPLARRIGALLFQAGPAAAHDGGRGAGLVPPEANAVQSMLEDAIRAGTRRAVDDHRAAARAGPGSGADPAARRHAAGPTRWARCCATPANRRRTCCWINWTRPVARRLTWAGRTCARRARRCGG